MTLVERHGEARSIHIPTVTADTLGKTLVSNAKRQSDLMTDDAHAYYPVGSYFASHETVAHSYGE